MESLEDGAGSGSHPAMNELDFGRASGDPWKAESVMGSASSARVPVFRSSSLSRRGVTRCGLALSWLSAEFLSAEGAPNTAKFLPGIVKSRLRLPSSQPYESFVCPVLPLQSHSCQGDTVTSHCL